MPRKSIIKGKNKLHRPPSDNNFSQKMAKTLFKNNVSVFKEKIISKQ